MTSPMTAWCSSQRSQSAERVLEHLRADDRDHPLLALADHHLPRLHPLLAQRHAVEPEVDPALARHLRERGGEPGGAAVLQRLDEPRLDELDRDLDQLLAGERIADLDGRPLVGVVLAELLAREHGGAADPVAAGRRAVEDDEVARAGRAGARDPVGGQEPDAHRVHEHVVAVRLVEDGLAADGRHADRVPVRADPGDGAVEARVAGREAQPVEQRDRPRAHRDDVAQDPADPGRRALERLDRRRVVVALDLEADRLAVAEIEHARVLTGALQHAFPLRGKPFQEEGRVLVAAVLRPEQREDRQLEVVRLAPEQLDDALQLPVGQSERAVKGLIGDLGQVVQCRREARRRRPRLERGVSRRHLIMLLRARRDLGLVVHVHHDRAARPRALDADPLPDGLRRAGAGALRPRSRATASRSCGRTPGRSRCSALINTAVPFFLIAWGQQYIDSGLAAIFNASAPLFTALFALSIDRSQRVTGLAARRRRARLRRRRPPRRLRARRRRAGRRRRARRRRRRRLLRRRRALRGQALRRPAARARRVRVARLGDALRPRRSAPRRRRRSAGRRSSPCSTSASPRPASPTSSTSA